MTGGFSLTNRYRCARESSVVCRWFRGCCSRDLLCFLLVWRVETGHRLDAAGELAASNEEWKRTVQSISGVAARGAFEILGYEVA